MNNENFNCIMNAIESLHKMKSANDKKIVIFGLGQRGIILNKKLSELGIKVNFFCDNDNKKHNKKFGEIECISFDELKKHKGEAIVIVSPKNNSDIVNQLAVNGFKEILNDTNDLYDFLKFIPGYNMKNLTNFYEFGHYYSLYPNLEEIKQKEKEIFSQNKLIKDIDFNINKQCDMLMLMKNLYDTIPDWIDIASSEATKYRHRLSNISLSFADAVVLHCMLRILKPKNMIEVGSGYTSAVTLDTNEFYLQNSINLSFIEPYPDLLKSLLKPTDDIKILDRGLQDIELSYFDILNEGDILFIDSTHVSKVNSDVNYLFFEILPRLKKGVYIHLHDIFYPFEYPKEWIYKGMIWNELYLLRAFLQNNNDYEIIFFQNMMMKTHEKLYREEWPFNHSLHGGSFWMRKIR